jgi:predicted trehalose synthase
MPAERPDQNISQNDSDPSAPCHIDIKLSGRQVDANPGLVVPYLKHRFHDKRWFLEKDAVIDAVVVADSFRISATSGLITEGVIARFDLRSHDRSTLVKRYLVPVILSASPIESVSTEDGFVLQLVDGVRHLYWAEHFLAHQKAILPYFKNSAVIPTARGATVRFRPAGRILSEIDETELSVNPTAMAFSSSNVLTFLDSAQQSVVSKTYKDLRGASGRPGKIWPPNPEPERYEILAAASYPNIPQLLGAADYISPDGQRAPLVLMTQAIRSGGQLGDVFSAGLARLLDDRDAVGSGEAFKKYDPYKQGMRIFIHGVLRTVVDMHKAFAHSSPAGFGASPAATDDLCNWSDTVRNNLIKAMAALEKRCRDSRGAAALQELSGMLDHFGSGVKTAASGADSPRGPIANAIVSLRNLDGIIMKAPVHGDLHLDQGLLETAENAATIETLVDAIQSGNLQQIRHQSTQITSQIKWIDFEGPPARELVRSNHDVRASLPVDLAGLVQSLLYIVHTTLYEYLGLNYQNSDDHETQRKASLVLLGHQPLGNARITGLHKNLTGVLRSWLKDMTAFFIEGYLDEIESQGLGNMILSSWNRDVARALVNYWILARAIHEFGYETYGRDWGWEAIAAGRIIQLAKQGDIAGRLNKAVALA